VSIEHTVRVILVRLPLAVCIILGSLFVDSTPVAISSVHILVLLVGWILLVVQCI
jgi:hypothetical protein